MMKKLMRTAAMATAIATSGCVTTQTMTDEEALARYPQTGIEAVAGEWEGKWTYGGTHSKMRVKAPSADDIEVRLCYAGWCAGGCTRGSCATHGTRLKKIRFEDEQLRFMWRQGEFVFTRNGAGLDGTHSAGATTHMKRKRK